MRRLLKSIPRDRATVSISGMARRAAARVRNSRGPAPRAGDAAEQPFQVADGGQRIAQRRARRWRRDQRRRRCACRRAISARSRSGCPIRRRRARAPMGGAGQIEHAEQAAARAAGAERARQLQVAAGRGIEPDPAAGRFDAQPGQQRQQRRVRALQVGERSRPAAPTAAGISAQPKPASERTRNCAQSSSVARSGDQRHDSRRVRCPGRRLPSGGSGASSGTSVSAGLRRATSSASRAAASSPPSSATANSPVLTSTQASPQRVAEAMHRRQVAVFARGEQRGIGDRAGGDDAGDGPLDQPAAGRGHLLGDGDGVARGQQAAQIVVEGVVRDARHRRPAGAAERARGQGDAGIPRQDLGVLVEGLVEVAEAIEEDRAGVLRFQLEILPARGDERFARPVLPAGRWDGTWAAVYEGDRVRGVGVIG